MTSKHASLPPAIALLIATLLGMGLLRPPGSHAGTVTPVRNVLLIVSDDLRADALACYGDPISRTPGIDRLAREGIVFEQAYCQGTWCLPSRRSFMHGQYVSDTNLSLGEHLRSHGIHTRRIAKIFHMRVPGDIIDGTDGNDVAACWDLRRNMPGREAHSEGSYACLNQNIFHNRAEGRQSTGDPHRPYVTVRLPGDGRDQPDHKAATLAQQWLRELRDQPFLLAVGLVRPHYPMVAPEAIFQNYPWDKQPLIGVPDGDLDDIPMAGISGSNSNKNGLEQFPDNQRRMWTGYRASIEFMDAQVNRILATLDETGLAKNTLVIFTSDHGYHMGDHTFWQKANLHEQVARVPLIMRHPEATPARSQSLVELVDLYPTICEALQQPLPEKLEGKSLIPLLADPGQEVREAALTIHTKGKRHAHLLRTRQWAYMQYPDGTEELYDMRSDPGQFTNLASTVTEAKRIQSFRDVLAKRLAEIEGSKP
ncbi:MAG: sulfatase [Planctomycetota bacterium]